MGTSRQTTPRRGATLGDSDADRWLRCEECGFFEFQNEDYLRKLWSDNRDDIVAEFAKENPGTRPEHWWTYSAPRSPRGTYKGCAYDGELPEPRKRLGGVGTVASDVLNIKPSFSCGIPNIWVSEFDVEYYGGTLRHVVTGQLVNPNPARKFKGVAIDPNNPPTYESEASYLDRHGLFLPGEKKRLKKADFEPETLAYVDE